MDYLFGYNGTRLTVKELEKRFAWSRLHPEFRRRLIALFDDAQKNLTDLGIGGGWRSSETQEQLFVSRYHVSTFGTVRWDGKRWTKNKGVADAAPPYSSFHESTDTDGFAFAADLVGDLEWMNENCAKYGLIHFKNVNKEPWHVQPTELPNSRRRYKGEQLTVWNLPSQPIVQENGEIDMIVLNYMKDTPKWISFLWTGDTLQWIVNGHAYSVLENAGVKTVNINKDQLLGVVASCKPQGALPSGTDRTIAAAWNKKQT